jgi:hypothetical protein
MVLRVVGQLGPSWGKIRNVFAGAWLDLVLALYFDCLLLMRLVMTIAEEVSWFSLNVHL